MKKLIKWKTNEKRNYLKRREKERKDKSERQGESGKRGKWREI